jgi:hypothetical protein
MAVVLAQPCFSTRDSLVTVDLGLVELVELFNCRDCSFSYQVGAEDHLRVHYLIVFGITAISACLFTDCYRMFDSLDNSLSSLNFLLATVGLCLQECFKLVVLMLRVTELGSLLDCALTQ